MLQILYKIANRNRMKTNEDGGGSTHEHKADGDGPDDERDNGASDDNVASSGAGEERPPTMLVTIV